VAKAELSILRLRLSHADQSHSNPQLKPSRTRPHVANQTYNQVKYGTDVAIALAETTANPVSHF